MKKLRATLIVFLVVLFPVLAWSTGTWTTNHWLFAPPAGPNYDANYKTGLDQVDARLSKVIYVGDPGYATFAAAVTAISSTTATLFLPAGTHVGTGVTTPITLEVIALHGAMISGTPTINGPFAGDLSQHFTGQPSGTPKIEAVHPEWFGAVVDGATDDSAALNKAKIFAVGAKVPLIIPVGTTKGSIALLSTDDGLTIQGESPYNSILTAKDDSTAVIQIPAGCHYVTIRDFVITNTAGNNDTHYGIHSLGDGAGNGASYLTINNIQVSDFNTNIKLDEFNGHNILNVRSTAAVYNGADYWTGCNLYAGHSTNHSIGIWISKGHFDAGQVGIYLENAEGSSIDSTECLANTLHGGVITAAGGDSCNGTEIVNSWFDGSGAGSLLMERQINAMLNTVWLSSPATVGAGDYGLKWDTVRFSSGTNLTAYGCTGHGVTLVGSYFNSISSSISTSNGVGGTGAGYILDNGSYNNTFNADIAWNNPTIGFHFLDTTAGKPNIITGGISEGNTGGQYVIQAKDLISSSQNSNGGQGLTLPYYRSNLADGAATGKLYAVPNTDQTLFVSQFTGSLTSISLVLNDTRAAGTLNARPLVNGVAKDDLKVTIDGTNTKKITLTALAGAIPIAINDEIEIYYDTDAGWDTTGGAGTVDATATLTILAQ